MLKIFSSECTFLHYLNRRRGGLEGIFWSTVYWVFFRSPGETVRRFGEGRDGVGESNQR
jgi:hypothetical protein